MFIMAFSIPLDQGPDLQNKNFVVRLVGHRTNTVMCMTKALMINVKAQLMERDAIFVQLLANYLKCNAIELLR